MNCAIGTCNVKVLVELESLMLQGYLVEVELDIDKRENESKFRTNCCDVIVWRSCDVALHHKVTRPQVHRRSVSES